LASSLNSRALSDLSNIIFAAAPVKVTSSVNVDTPVAFNPDVFPNILNPLAVTTPTASTLVTSS